MTDDKPIRIDTVVISTQHSRKLPTAQIREEVIEHIIKPVLPMALARCQNEISHQSDRTLRGRRTQGDCGLTGRKIIVDTYGGMGRHGGGAFSGKDPTKVDRSACYMARYVAKNSLRPACGSCEIQLAYAIGVADPCRSASTRSAPARSSRRRSSELIRENFQLTPRGIIESAESAPADLPQDCQLWSLRSQRTRIQLGKNGQSSKLKSQAGL